MNPFVRMLGLFQHIWAPTTPMINKFDSNLLAEYITKHTKENIWKIFRTHIYMRRGWGAPPHPPRRVGSPAPPCGGGLGAGVVHIKFPLPGIWTSSFSVQGVSIPTFFTKLCFAKAFAQRFSYPKPPDFPLKCFWVAPHSGAH